MKVISLFILIFVAILVYAGVDRSTGITGVTQKNGDGCICHNPTPTANVFVRIEGPSILLRGQTSQYTIKLSGGAAVMGGFNAAALFGDLNVSGAGVQKIIDELTHTAPQNFIDTVVSWTFNFTALDSVYTDTLYCAGNSVNGDGIPSALDTWNFGAKFPIVVQDVVPVELTSFTALISNNSVSLKWITATELNNRGFYVERSNLKNSNEWKSINFINGSSSTTETKHYSYTDNSPLQGISYYRLKQVDYDGSFTYSSIVEVNNNAVVDNFILAQNYPNPFNPSTTISWQSQLDAQTSLKIYDILGNEVATLLDEYKPAGNYDVSFDAANLPGGRQGLSSGIYYYSITVGSLVQTKKMIILK
jgi:hypothetical protein